MDKCPSVEELDQYIVPNYSVHLRAMEILLKIHNGKPNVIAINSVHEECCIQMLNEWLKD